MTVSGVFGGICTYTFKKPALVMAMSFGNASQLTTAINYFVEHTNAKYFWRDMPADHVVYSLSDSWWTLSVICLALFVVALRFQFLVFVRGVDYELGKKRSSRYRTRSALKKQRTTSHSRRTRPTLLGIPLRSALHQRKYGR